MGPLPTRHPSDLAACPPSQTGSSPGASALLVGAGRSGGRARGGAIWGRGELGHSPGQASGDAEQVHDVAGVTVLAEDHLQDTAAGHEGREGGTGFHDDVTARSLRPSRRSAAAARNATRMSPHPVHPYRP